MVKIPFNRASQTCKSKLRQRLWTSLSILHSDILLPTQAELSNESKCEIPFCISASYFM